MTVHLQDNRAARAMTVDEADQLFQRIAEIEIAMTAELAGYEQEIAAVKARAAAAEAYYCGVLKPAQEQLTAYINAHPERFVKPRKRKTEFGEYGLQSATKLYVLDECAALISVKAQGIPAVVVTEKLDKKALEAAIRDGMKVTGAEIRKGEIAKYKVAQPLLDNAGVK